MNDTASPPRCVLLVEDEMMLAMLVDDILTDAGYRVVKAARIDAALQLAQGDQPIDAAILDINLAGKEVFPVARQLRADGVPFLFSSGYGDRGLIPEFSGCTVLQKPYRPDALVAAVAALMQ